MKKEDIRPGIYEQVINKDFDEGLSELDSRFKEVTSIDTEESTTILTNYLQNVLRKGFAQIADNAKKEEILSSQINFANKIIELIKDHTNDSDFAKSKIMPQGQELFARFDETMTMRNVTAKSKMPRPETSLIETSLFTGAQNEPTMFGELKQEILSSNKIDILVSFIKWSGLRLIIDELAAFTKSGGQLRVIATTYMGATDAKAIAELSKLANTKIKISYDTKRTRLHAKAYIFHRDTSYDTAYIGSSNLSNAAISSGLEWNVKITSHDSPATMRKVEATFESYWNSTDFEDYSAERYNHLVYAIAAERAHEFTEEKRVAYHFTITPFAYQKNILELLEAERTIRNNNRNLVVAATGTGKTVIAAFDYLRFCKQHRGCANRLLFIAHRAEILKQSLLCFRGILNDANFGDLFVGNNRPTQLDHLFMSVQTFNSQNWMNKTNRTTYDFIIVDEMHHGAAESYQKIFEYYQPKILLGLTATPERRDGKNILEYFGGHITAELRLPEAIERGLLCPFQYFGVTDTINLDNVSWKSGGYDKQELSNLYTLSSHIANKRADHVIRSIEKYTSDIAQIHGLGFCVSIAHAKFMAEYFTEHNIPSIYLTADSDDETRNSAKSKLEACEINFIFVVDLYNEGVDIPCVDTVLFLRPTESLTIFLQQLGRGLRLCEGKDCLTVLDFIGQADRRYRFEEKFASLLTKTHRSIKHEIEHGFQSMPHGCYIELERKAAEYVLDNIKSSLSTKQGIISKIDDFRADSTLPLTLSNFLSYCAWDIRSFYRENLKSSFARLCVSSNAKDDFAEPDEKQLTSALPRIAAIDSRRWLGFLLQLLPNLDKIHDMKFTEVEQRMLQMLHFTIWQTSVENSKFESVEDSLFTLKQNPILLDEITEILQYRFDHIDFIDKTFNAGFACPLDVYCHYSRDQIFAAYDYYKPNTIRQGVFYVEDKKTDIFMITLNKSEKAYSPSTMYNDYSMNEYLFHWQSQSTTSDTSPTANRYFHHKETGNKILLFVRENKKDISGTAPYIFLGTANYVSHTGSKPIDIIWRLDNPIPARLLSATNKLALG